MNRTFSFIACVGMLAIPALSQAQIANADFSAGTLATGDIGSWNRFPATAPNPVGPALVDGQYAQWGGGTADMGTDLGSVNPPSGPASISQSVNFAAGATALSFDLNVLTDDTNGGPDTLGVYLDNVLAGNVPIVSGNQTVNFNAAGGSQVLSFRLTGDGDGNDPAGNSDTQIQLDNLVLRTGGQVPEPGTWAAMLMGGLGLAGFLRRRK